MLAVLLSELEKPESRDVECDCAPSVLEPSSEYRCLSSKLGTVRIVEFMRLGVRGAREEEPAGGFVLLLTPLVAARGMAELSVPFEAGVRVDRGEGCSCEAFGVRLGAGLVGVRPGAVSVVGTTFTDGRRRPWEFTVSLGQCTNSLRGLGSCRNASMARHLTKIAAIQTQGAASCEFQRHEVSARAEDPSAQCEGSNTKRGSERDTYCVACCPCGLQRPACRWNAAGPSGACAFLVTAESGPKDAEGPDSARVRRLFPLQSGSGPLRVGIFRVLMASIGCLSLVITAGLDGRSLDGVLEGNDSRSVPVDGSLADGAMLDV
jgi:hypothetical protein